MHRVEREDANYQSRFGGMQRLYGRLAQDRLRRAHVCVVGVGGVGSWAVEALARSGIGCLTLVDLDDVCISNVNRQLPALTGSFGKPKVDVLAERVALIHPGCRVQPVRELFTPSNADRLLDLGFDFLFDAIDGVSHKCHLIAGCMKRRVRVLTAGSAGGRRDPTRIEIVDLNRASHDRLLAQVRKKLRGDHGFTRWEGKRFGVDCVLSREEVVYPQSDGTVCGKREPGSDRRLDCQSGYGTASFVTGAFGFAAAGYIVG
jgi:tRNA A37 threonylcarbamoyladenosine dehydratase